jgi:hypothetical protein
MNNAALNDDWNWLESKRRYDRYATGPEHSVWICGYCGEENVDPDEHDEDCEVVDG